MWWSSPCRWMSGCGCCRPGMPCLRGWPQWVRPWLLNAIATVLYIGAGMGPGPRDGLMTGLVRRTGLSVWVVRTTIEVTVLSTGWLLGGSVGVGTLVYAFGIGPLIQLMIPAVNRYLPGFESKADPE